MIIETENKKVHVEVEKVHLDTRKILTMEKHSHTENIQ